MRIQFFYFLLLCSGTLCAQNWVQKASPPGGIGIDAPISFTINGKLYVGGGWNGSTALSSFAEYDPNTNVWTVKANLPTGVFSSACFAINGKGYVCCGTKNPPLQKSVYEYDPITNTWATKNNFPGSARQNVVGFSLNGKGYMFGGFIGGSSVISEMWEYDPTPDSWVQKASAPGVGRNGPAFLIINGAIYVGLGGDAVASAFYSDFYKYDPVANSYTAVANIPIARESPANFTIGNIGYIGIGYGSTGQLNGFYTYDPVANIWTVISNFGRSGSFGVFSEVLYGRPYVGCGVLSSGYAIDTWTWDTCLLKTSIGNDTSYCGSFSRVLRTGDTLAIWSTGHIGDSITVTAPGTYKATYTSACGLVTDSIKISQTNFPQINIGNDTTYCGAFSRTLTTTHAGTHWSTGVVGASITVSSGGTYWAQDSNACGVKRDSIVITQNAIPNVKLGNDTAICAGTTIVLRATTAGGSYQWQNSTSADTLLVSSAGLYWVDVTVQGCTSRDSIQVSTLTPPSAIFIGNDTTYCGAFSRTLTTTHAGTHWSTGVVGASITISSGGTYWAQDSNACGVKRDSIVLGDNPIPVVNLGADTIICTGSSLSLHATIPTASYQWQDGSGADSFRVTNAGLFWVAATVNGCTGRDSIVVSLVNSTLADLGPDTSICIGDSLRIGKPINITSQYRWNTGESTPSIVVFDKGTYILTISNVCGIYSDTINIDQLICKCDIAIPSAFSPNGDRVNDKFRILATCEYEAFTLHIYNRWGQLIYDSNDMQAGWDGSYQGNPQPVGVYAYYTSYRDPKSGKMNQQCGNITLVR